MEDLVIIALETSSTSSEFFDKVKILYDQPFADAYPKALTDLFIKYKTVNETAYAFLTRVFNYLDLNVAEREAKMIEDQTGYY